MEELIEFVSHLPLPAAMLFAGVLASVIGLSWRGILKGRELDPARDVPAAQIASIIVDPTALNALTSAVTKQTDVMKEMLDTGKALAKTFDHMAIELDRLREEVRIQRELSRRN